MLGLRPQSAAYPWYIAAFTLVCVSVRGSLPSSAGWVYDVALVGPVMLLVGVPHGALDHLLSAAVAWLDPKWGPPGLFSRSLVRSGARQAFPSSPLAEPRFFVWYLGLCAAYMAAWWAFPLWSSLAFAALTAWHFGETDVEALSVDATAEAHQSSTLRLSAGHRLPSAASTGPVEDATAPAASCSGSGFRVAAIASTHRMLYGTCLLMSLLMFDRHETAFQLEAILGDTARGSALPQQEQVVIIRDDAAEGADAARLLASPLPSSGSSAVAWFAFSLWSVPQAVWLAAAIALSIPPLVAAIRRTATPPQAWIRWGGFVMLLLACAVAGRIGGIAVPFSAYFGGWHSMQALAHVGSVVSREQLEAQGWGSWVARVLMPKMLIHRFLMAVTAWFPRAAALIPREAFKARSSAASGEEGTLELSPRDGDGSAAAAAVAAGSSPSNNTDAPSPGSSRSDAGAAAPPVDAVLAGNASATAKQEPAAADFDVEGGAGLQVSSTKLAGNHAEPTLSPRDSFVFHKAGTLALWLNTVPLSIGAFLFLLPLSLLLPEKASSLSDTQSPLPPVVLVLLAVLTLPHAQIMHASYGAYAELTSKLAASARR